MSKRTRTDRADTEILFDMDSTVPDTAVKDKYGIGLYRTRTVKAGDMAYVSIYPIWDTQGNRAARRAMKQISREAQKKLNENRARTKMVQLINANFADGDLFLTLTFREADQPQGDEEARRLFKNFIKRLERLYRGRGIELKYVYVHEKTGNEKDGIKHHYHMVLSGGVDRDEVESKWKAGFANSRRCESGINGLEGLGVYMTKQLRNRHERAWAYSKNLVKPREYYANHKFTPRQAARVEESISEVGCAVIERAYPGYKLTEEIKVRRSGWINGIYITAKMRRQT